MFVFLSCHLYFEKGCHDEIQTSKGSKSHFICFLQKVPHDVSDICRDEPCAICGAHRGALELCLCFKHRICGLVINGWSTWRGFLPESAGSPQEALCALQQGLMHLREHSLTKEAVIRKTKERRVPVIIGWRTKKKKKIPKNRQLSETLRGVMMTSFPQYTGN